MKLLTANGALLVACVCVVFGSNAARADFTFQGTVTNKGDFDPNQQSAKAVFSLSGNTLTITLTNLEKNSGSNLVGQGMALSGITFRIKGGTLSGASVASASGSEVTLANTTGAFAAATSLSTKNVLTDTHWGLDNNGGNVLDLHSPDSAAKGNPTHMILGAPAVLNKDGTGNYDVISGNVAQFNPYFFESATFTLTVTGINPSSFSIDNVLFSFGTSNNEHTATGELVVVPGPSSLVLAGVGIVAMLPLAVRRRQKAALACSPSC